MKLMDLLEIFLRNTTNPAMGMAPYQSNHSKVTFRFLQSPFSPTFFKTKVFRPLHHRNFSKVDQPPLQRDLERFKLWESDSKSGMTTRREIHLPTT